jgi:hypothetical protein
VALALLGAGVVNAGETRLTPAARGAPAVPGSRARTPAGAVFPTCWKFDFEVPAGLKVGQPCEVVIGITALRFDLENVELTPSAGGDLVMTAGEPWKGTLKQGETHRVKITLKAGIEGDNGPYGVAIKAPGFYDAVRAYVQAQTEGAYASPAAKISVMEQVDGMQADLPVYTEWAGTTLKVAVTGGQ